MKGITITIAKVEPIQKKWLSKEEAMKYLGCSETFLKKLRNDALVSFSRFGGKMYWYDLASIERFISKNKVV